MKHASRFYDGFQTFVSQSDWADLRHLAVLVGMLVRLIEEGKVNLTCWISRVETKALCAQSTPRRFARWLHNARINVARLIPSLDPKRLIRVARPGVVLVFRYQ